MFKSLPASWQTQMRLFHRFQGRLLNRLFWTARIGALAFALLLTSATSPPAGHAAFPGVNGKIVFSSNRTGTSKIYVMNADGTGQTNLTNNLAGDGSPAWSSDGTKITFVSLRDGNPQIYVMNADGTGQTRLTNNLANDGFPSWSPDGTKITFIRSSGPRSGDVYVMNADGTGQTKLTNNTPGNFPDDFSTAWSPDGTKIAFGRSLSDTNTEIYSMNADGSGLKALTSNGVNSRFPNYSPDGTKIVFDRGPAGSADIYVMNADGSGQTNLTNNGGQINQEAAWSPDGTKITFVSFRDGDGEIYVMNADGTGQTKLTVNPRNGKPDWQPLPIPFASFAAEVEIELGEPLANDDKFEVEATFTLGAGSNGINPLTEDVKLQVGTFSTTIPAGSFRQDEEGGNNNNDNGNDNGSGNFKFEGVINGVTLEAEIQPLGGNSFEFKAEGKGANLTGTVNPVTVRLIIGDDGGSTTVIADFENDNQD